MATRRARGPSVRISRSRSQSSSAVSRCVRESPGGTAKYGAVQTELIRIDPILFILIAYVVANLGALILFAADKRRARLRLRRLPERTLLLSAVAGPFGALAGMSAFHHKTRKLRFVVAVPFLVALHAAVILTLFGTGPGP